MKPDNETIDKFQKLYFEEFGEEITKQEAYEKFLRLTNFMRVVLRPDLDIELDDKSGHDIFISRPSDTL
jgi:hypothetical protein